MEKIKIFDDLIMFSSYIGFINLSFNQFLLTGNEPVLIHTGSIEQTTELLPLLKESLNGRKLSYIFISHFESDECGGLGYLLEQFPEAIPVCSMVTARQLTGFGITKNVIMKNPDDILTAGEYKFKFIAYPSEMHLWQGLMAFEESQGLLFSSDLFIRMGAVKESIVGTNYEEEINNITPDKIPSSDARAILQENMRKIPVKYIMPGHGPCLKV